MKIILKLTYLLVLLLATSCSNNVETPLMSNALPPIFPDYIGVTIPAEIAPMNFDIAQGVSILMERLCVPQFVEYIFCTW